MSIFTYCMEVHALKGPEILQIIPLMNSNRYASTLNKLAPWYVLVVNLGTHIDELPSIRRSSVLAALVDKHIRVRLCFECFCLPTCRRSEAASTPFLNARDQGPLGSCLNKVQKVPSPQTQIISFTLHAVRSSALSPTFSQQFAR